MDPGDDYPLTQNKFRETTTNSADENSDDILNDILDLEEEVKKKPRDVL